MQVKVTGRCDEDDKDNTMASLTFAAITSAEKHIDQ